MGPYFLRAMPSALTRPRSQGVSGLWIYSNRFEWLACPLYSRCLDLTRSSHQSLGRGTRHFICNIYLILYPHVITISPTVRGHKLSPSPEDRTVEDKVVQEITWGRQASGSDFR